MVDNVTFVSFLHCKRKAFLHAAGSPRLTLRKVDLDQANSPCQICVLLLRYGNGKVSRTTPQQDRRMEATISPVDTDQAQKQTTKDYKSPRHALIWFFRKSRDLWKSKYQELKGSVKQLKNRVADLTKSRELWKLKAEQANDQLTVLEAEIASLRAQVATLAEKKRPRHPPLDVQPGRTIRTVWPAVFCWYGAAVRVDGDRLQGVHALRGQRDQAAWPGGAVRRNRS